MEYYCGPGYSEELSGPYVRHVCTFDPYYLGYLNINVRYENCSITYTANCNHLGKLELAEFKEYISALSPDKLFEHVDCYECEGYYDEEEVWYALFALVVGRQLKVVDRTTFVRYKSDL